MIVSIFVDMYKKEPAKDPVGDFINDVSRPLITKWSDPPAPKLTYSFVKQGADTITIQAANPGGEVSIFNTQLSVRTGNSDECLFQERSFHLDTDKDAKEGGKATLTPTELVKATLRPTLMREKPAYWVYNLWATGMVSKENKMGPVKVGKGKKLESVWTGKIKPAAQSMIEIVETFVDGDSAHKVLPVQL